MCQAWHAPAIQLSISNTHHVRLHPQCSTKWLHGAGGEGRGRACIKPLAAPAHVQGVWARMAVFAAATADWASQMLPSNRAPCVGGSVLAVRCCHFCAPSNLASVVCNGAEVQPVPAYHPLHGMPWASHCCQRVAPRPGVLAALVTSAWQACYIPTDVSVSQALRASCPLQQHAAQGAGSTMPSWRSWPSGSL